MEGMICIGPGGVATGKYLDVGVAIFGCQTGSFDGERSGGASTPEDQQLVLVFTETRGDLTFLVQFRHFGIGQVF